MQDFGGEGDDVDEAEVDSQEGEEHAGGGAEVGWRGEDAEPGGCGGRGFVMLARCLFAHVEDQVGEGSWWPLRLRR